MGLISAVTGAFSSTMADQWKEFFYCDAIDPKYLMVRGHKRTSGRASNNKGDDNVITNGSVIAVADGQCMLIVDQGKVADLCAVPGEYTYDQSTEPSIFTGKLGSSILETFKVMGKRFTFGGDSGKEQRVYYINTKEIMGNMYGTPNKIPFRVVDQRAGIDIDISIGCFGEYSYQITDPITFYTKICGNEQECFERSRIDSQLKSEIQTALQPALGKISAMGIRYSELMVHTEDIAKALNDVLSEKWGQLRGIEVVSFGVNSVNADEEDEKMLKEMQKEAAYLDPNRVMAYRAKKEADAWEKAASNPGGAGGAMVGLMNMNMMQNTAANSGMNQILAGQMQQQTPPPINNISYNVAINGQAAGPYDLETLRSMKANGQFTADSLVWKSGMADWAKAGTMADLKSLFEQAPPIPGAGAPPIPPVPPQ